VDGQDNVRNEVACGRHDSDSALAELDMHGTVEESGESVAGEWRQEDERYHGVVEVVVFLKLRGVREEVQQRVVLIHMGSMPI
jgi:hypothetical protein